MDAVKSLLEVDEVYEWSLPFTALLSDVPESEDLVNTTLAFPESSLFVSDSCVYC